MKVFDIIRLMVMAIPVGMFVTYSIFIAITYTLKVKPINSRLRVPLTIYSVLACISGFMILVYYFFPDIYVRFSIIYTTCLTFAMVVYYHFFFFTSKSPGKFGIIQYVFPFIAFVVLIVTKYSFPVFWENYGSRATMFMALPFAATYTILPLYKMYKLQLQHAAHHGKVDPVDKERAVPFVTLIILFPFFKVIYPLAFGPYPSVAASILIMATLILALSMNIPLTYGIIRHYAVVPIDKSLFNNQPSIQTKAPDIVKIDNNKEKTKRTYKRYPIEQRSAGTLVELDMRLFEQYIRKHKPFLNPNLTIYDLVEPLKSNRTYISKFVNQVYGMNFASYVNLCRLYEIERLRQLPSSKKKSNAELAGMAGFGNYSGYHRAKKQLGHLLNNRNGF